MLLDLSVVRVATAQVVAILTVDRRARRFAVGLVSVALVLICIPALVELSRALGAPLPEVTRNLRLDADGALPEIFNYVQAGLCAWFLYRAFRVSGVRIFAAFAALFAFIVLDDALNYHEKMGDLVAATGLMPEIGGLAADDLGELVAWGLAGLVFLVPILGALR